MELNNIVMKASKTVYEKPTLVKVEQMVFMFEPYRSKKSKVACRQCSGCHGCR